MIEEKLEIDSKSKNKYFKQYLAVISATIVSTVAGINFAWPSPSIPRLLSGELPFNITKEEASYIAITSPIGSIIGGPLSAFLVDVIGRKGTLLTLAAPQFLSFIFIYFAKNSLQLLYLARLLGGIGEGASFTIVAMYIGEVAHKNIRGSLGSYISLCLRIGILLVNIVGSYCSLATSSLIFALFPLIFLITFIFMPESPHYYLMKRKRNEAMRSLAFLCREDELSDMSRDVARQISESGTLSDLFKIHANRRALLIALGLRTFQQFSGISAFSLYTQILFKEALDGDSIAPITAAIIYSVIQLLTTFTSSIIVDKTGRKSLLCFSCISCVFVLIIEAVFFTMRDYCDVDVQVVKWLPLVGMIVFIIVFAVGLGTVVNLMLSELFSASIKPKALAVVNVYFAVAMAITTKFFQFMTDRTGLAVPFYVFAFSCFLGAIFCYKVVPETKGKTLEEIQQALKFKNKEKETFLR